MSSRGLNIFGDTSEACQALAKKDKALAFALDEIGEPFIRRRPGGFEALFRIIVEQQVSVASAQAIWARCEAQYAPFLPVEVIHQNTEGLRACGVSRPKVKYILGLAEAVQSGALDFEHLEGLDDEAAAAALEELKGIGPWTAAIYLLFCEGRIDIWPRGDVALLGAYRRAHSDAGRRGEGPDMKIFDRRAEKWAPLRGLAAHILWTYYAKIRGRTPI